MTPIPSPPPFLVPITLHLRKSIYLTVKRNCKIWKLWELRFVNGKDAAGLENRRFQVRFILFVKSLRNVTVL